MDKEKRRGWSRSPFGSGFQYTSKIYSNRLKDYDIKSSHFRNGNCLVNACIESFFSHLKTEKLYISKVYGRRTRASSLELHLPLQLQKKLKKRAPIEYRNALTA
ncbi:hypothetical protein MHI57_12240 [Cytobacillus sp. FSL K6-0129]